MRFFKNWDEEQRLIVSKIAGFVVLVFALFVLIATTSYFFSWKQDMSLLTNPDAMSQSANVSNLAGKFGFKMGNMLVSELFGLGSLFILLFLVAVFVRLIFKKWRRPLFRTALVSLFGAFISSFVCAYIASFLGLEYAFGGGLGGRCGALVCAWGQNLVGTTIWGLILLLLVVIFLLCSSKSFSRLLSKSPRPKVEDIETEVKEEETQVEDVPLEETIVDEPEEQAEEQAEQVSEEVNSGPGFTIDSDDSGILDKPVTEELKPINVRLDEPEGLPKYKFPSLDLLDNYESSRREVSEEELIQNNNKILATLANYKIQISDITAVVGPTVTLYKVYPAPGVKISEIKRLQEDIGISLNANGVRVITLPDSVGIEVANEYRSIVPLKNMLASDAFRNTKYELPVAIGYTITRNVEVFDLTDAPHLLVAGATKQGKSVGLNVIINSLIYAKHPAELKFVFIDPKMVEFNSYNNLLKHYLAVLPDASSEEEERKNAIVKTVKDAERVLRSLCLEMDERYHLMEAANVNNIVLYNDKYKKRHLRPDHGHRFMPYLVVVIDEYADLAASAGVTPEAKTRGKSITNSIIRLAQKGRAAGLHVILATQRPSVNIISGDIKANFPMRIAFRTLSGVDSRTILDMPGAEKLIGKGDMLLYSGVKVERLQCALIGPHEIDRIGTFISEQTKHGACYNTPYYLPLPVDESSGSAGGSMGGGGSLDVRGIDERFKEAAEMVVLSQKGSTSDLQRRLGMGYAKAGRVMDQLENAGIVGPQEGSKPRQVLIASLDELEEIYRNLNIY